MIVRWAAIAAWSVAALISFVLTARIAAHLLGLAAYPRWLPVAPFELWCAMAVALAAAVLYWSRR